VMLREDLRIRGCMVITDVTDDDNVVVVVVIAAAAAAVVVAAAAIAVVVAVAVAAVAVVVVVVAVIAVDLFEGIYFIATISCILPCNLSHLPNTIYYTHTHTHTHTYIYIHTYTHAQESVDVYTSYAPADVFEAHCLSSVRLVRYLPVGTHGSTT